MVTVTSSNATILTTLADLSDIISTGLSGLSYERTAIGFGEVNYEYKLDERGDKF